LTIDQSRHALTRIGFDAFLQELSQKLHVPDTLLPGGIPASSEQSEAERP
jgi:hypothetical protein